MLLAREALRIDRTKETEGTLLATLLRSPAALATYTLPIGSRPPNIAVAPNGRYFVVTDNTGHLRFYSTRTHRQLRPPSTASGTCRWRSRSRRRSQASRGRLAGKHGPTYDVLEASSLHVVRRLQLDTWSGRISRCTRSSGCSAGRPTALYVYGDPTEAWVDRWDLRSGKLMSRLRAGAGASRAPG